MSQQSGMSIRGKRYFIINDNTLHDLILFLLIVPIIEPEGIGYIAPFLARIVWGFLIRGMVAGILSIAFIWITIKRKSIDLAVLGVLSFALVSGMISFFKLHTLSSWFSRYLCIMYAAFLVAIYQKNLLRLIRMITVYLKILIIINFLFVLMYPEGMYGTKTYSICNWLLGYKSSLQYYVFPAITFSWLEAIYSKEKKKTIGFFAFLGLCIVEAALSRNTMLFLGLVIEAIFIVLHIERKTKLFNGFTYIIFSFIANIVLLFFVQIVLNTPMIIALLKLLGKNMTFSGRISLAWPRAIEAISQNLGFGYGVLSAEENIRMLGRGRLEMVHAHNHLLQIFLDGGIFLFCIYLIFVAIVVYRMMLAKKLKSTQVLGMSLFIQLIMVTVEIFTRNIGIGMWIIFLLCAMTKKLDHQFSADVSDTKTAENIPNKTITYY